MGSALCTVAPARKTHMLHDAFPPNCTECRCQANLSSNIFVPVDAKPVNWLQVCAFFRNYRCLASSLSSLLQTRLTGRPRLSAAVGMPSSPLCMMRRTSTGRGRLASGACMCSLAWLTSRERGWPVGVPQGLVYVGLARDSSTQAWRWLDGNPAVNVPWRSPTDGLQTDETVAVLDCTSMVSIPT